MDYRLTVTLGRESVDRGELLAEAQTLARFFTKGPRGGAGSEPPTRLVPDVLVDPVKAALQLVITIDAPDALNATILGLGRVAHSLQATQLGFPKSVLTFEAEAIPRPTGPNALPQHVDEV